MGKKSQITAILIVSVVILIAAASVVLLTRHQAKKTASQEATESKQVQLDAQPIKNFVERCLSITGKNGILLLGRQGGRIYASQNGPTPDYNEAQQGILFIDYKGSKIPYNILEPALLSGKYSAKIPQYPWGTFPYADGSMSSKTFEAKSVFGTSKLPPINKSFASNSMQGQLESYAMKSIGSCLDFSVFEQQGFRIKQGSKAISVAINENDVLFSMELPLEIRTVSDDLIELSDFTYRSSVRLGKIHAFASGTIEDDISNANFTINQTSGDFRADVVNDVYRKDDLIIIADSKSLIDGFSYEYTFARKNRNPALFYIGSGASIKEPASDSLKAQGKINALDPDEDSLFYSVDQIEGSRYRITVSDGDLEDYEETILVLEGSP